MADLIFNVLDWHEFDEYCIPDGDSDIDSDKKLTNSDKKYVIKAFGRTEDFKSVYLRIENFPPHFYVLLPESWTTNLQAKIEHVVNLLKSRNNTLEHTIEKYEIVRRKKLYGFNAGTKFNFMRLVFKNKKAMTDCSYMFNNKIMLFNSSNNRLGITERFVKFDVYESNKITVCAWILWTHLNRTS